MLKSPKTDGQDHVDQRKRTAGTTEQNFGSSKQGSADSYVAKLQNHAEALEGRTPEILGIYWDIGIS